MGMGRGAWPASLTTSIRYRPHYGWNRCYYQYAVTVIMEHIGSSPHRSDGPGNTSIVRRRCRSRGTKGYECHRTRLNADSAGLQPVSDYPAKKRDFLRDARRSGYYCRFPVSPWHRWLGGSVGRQQACHVRTSQRYVHWSTGDIACGSDALYSKSQTGRNAMAIIEVANTGSNKEIWHAKNRMKYAKKKEGLAKLPCFRSEENRVGREGKKQYTSN